MDTRGTPPILGHCPDQLTGLGVRREATPDGVDAKSWPNTGGIDLDAIARRYRP